MRVSRLERQYASTVEPPPEQHFERVIIYDPKYGVPEIPADAPPDMVFVLMPHNGRDHPEKEIVRANPLPVEPVVATNQATASDDTESSTAAPMTEDDQPRWRDETF
jgi:hypothetical protein